MEISSISNIIAQGIVAVFMIVIGYGAFLIVRDKDNLFKAKYGNRWFVNRADKEKLDAEWNRLTREQQQERFQRASGQSN